MQKGIINKWIIYIQSIHNKHNKNKNILVTIKQNKIIGINNKSSMITKQIAILVEKYLWRIGNFIEVV